MLVSFCTQSGVKKFNAKIHWNPENIFVKIFQVVRTLVFLSFGEIIYRSERFSDTIAIFKNIFTDTRINGAEIAAAMTPFGNGNQAAASVYRRLRRCTRKRTKRHLRDTDIYMLLPCLW